MLISQFLANSIHVALRGNGLDQTIMLQHVPAEHCAGERGRSRGVGHRNNLVIRERFGIILVMAISKLPSA